MIIQESIIINDKEYQRTYSDSGFYIERDGVEYSEAIDPLNSGREYTETDIQISQNYDATEDNGDIATVNDYRAVLAEFGVNV